MGWEKDTRKVQVIFAVALLGPALVLAQQPDLDSVERLVADATNKFRHEEGVETVKPNPALATAAQDFANYMANTDRYGHNADGRDPTDRAASHGYDYCLVSENIAYHYNSAGFRTAELARGVVEGWMHSPEHRKNMLEPAATDMAVAIARSGKSGRYYAVQMFGRPKSERTEFRITNAAPQAIKYQVANREYSLRPREGRIHWLCGPEDLTLQSAGGSTLHDEKLRPNNGDRLIVTSDAKGVSIRRQR